MSEFSFSDICRWMGLAYDRDISVYKAIYYDLYFDCIRDEQKFSRADRYYSFTEVCTDALAQSAQTTLTDRLKEALTFDAQTLAKINCMANERIGVGTIGQLDRDWLSAVLSGFARLAPIHERLIACVEAAAQIKDEIERSKKLCIGCANGGDLQDYDICRCCWRVYINGEKYLIWDWKKTEERLEALTALSEVLGKEGK